MDKTEISLRDERLLMRFIRVFGSYLSEDGHVDGAVIYSVVVSGFVHVDDWNSWWGDDDEKPRSKYRADQGRWAIPAA